jgi:hypothetical protein
LHLKTLQCLMTWMKKQKLHKRFWKFNSSWIRKWGTFITSCFSLDIFLWRIVAIS